MKYFSRVSLILFAILLGVSFTVPAEEPGAKNKKTKIEKKFDKLQNEQIEEEKQLSALSKRLDDQNKNLLELVKQAKDDPKWTDKAGVGISIIAAILTLLVVIGALFQEKIRRSYNEAFLDMELDKSPPGAVMSLMSMPGSQTTILALWLRIKVHHGESKKRFFAGKAAGENAEIIPLKVSMKDSAGLFNEIKGILPISLRWSNYPLDTPVNKNTSRVPYGFPRYCDLGAFYENDKGNAVFVVETLLKPNAGGLNRPLPNVLYPGTYKFELLLSGDNVHPLKKEWILEFNEWNKDEAKMIGLFTITAHT